MGSREPKEEQPIGFLLTALVLLSIAALAMIMILELLESAFSG